ncbi:MAG: DUF5615 family PIN-like protein [Chitinophagales bacterium]
MKFLADEGVDKQIVILLRENKFDVKYIAEENSGIEDTEILKIANKENRILITRDKDFGEIVFRTKKLHNGIILSRLFKLNSFEKAQLILKVILNLGNELTGAFTVIQRDKIRLKKQQS